MLEQLIKIVDEITLSEEQRESLFLEIKAIKKKLEVAEFKYNRTLHDKAAITNVLNASIKEIEKQKKNIEDAKNVIDRNLAELDKQKKLTEEKNVELNEAMTILKEAQEQLVQSEKMASLGQLTAGVAHEINNPINFVSANIKPLKEDLAEIMQCIQLYEQAITENKLETFFEKVEEYKNKTGISFSIEEVKSLLRGIEEGAARTSEIVKGLRNFSRLDQNVVKKTNLNEGIESTLALLHSAYKDRVEIVKDLGQIPEVDCLPGQLNQVFMNIISNAVQAIPGEGKIFIKTWATDNLVKISIKDTGPGMSDETKKKIFDPFFTTKDVGKGTGLGLSISYGIIQKHNGKIEVESVKGEGAVFIITLPIQQIKNEKLNTL
ncbi:MAG TPA: ATP-binding protein [Ferruginibacter sp.]|nr:hypothetical protein [Niastella sp.]HRB31313.1 ATP-binding protein [Ferruginibacter sp.]